MMKKTILYLFVTFFITISCKKNVIDASSSKVFQESINSMASSLNTFQQDKFNEALYILKTFGVEGETDLEKMTKLRQLLNKKNVSEIMLLADKIAQEKDIKWSSTTPPSLGTMNIFSSNTPTETDHNNIKASSLKIIITPNNTDSLSSINTILITPRLLDTKDIPIEFSNATLETTMEVFSNGNKIYTSKNLMQNHHFKGFSLKISSLPIGKVINNTIDISVSVKTTNKNYKTTKAGIKVNPNALQQPKIINEDEWQIEDSILIARNNEIKPSTKKLSPKSVVNSFLNNLATHNFKEAYNKSNNPNWESYDTFSNPTTGFGAVKNINIKKISTISSTSDNASVNALYEVTDKDGKLVSLNVTFGLKHTNSEWKIISYKIN